MNEVELLRSSGLEVPETIKRAPWLLGVPSMLLAAGSVANAWVSSLHSVMPAVVGVAEGLAWGLYLRAVAQSSGGVERPSPATAMGCMVLAFVAMQYGWVAAPAVVILWLLPIFDYATLYGEGVDAALGGVIDTLKRAPLMWLGVNLGLILMLPMLSVALSLPMSLYTHYESRAGAWLTELSGQVLVGPLVHVAFVLRARLFLGINGDP